MNRTVVAFLVAPLWVPLTVTPDSALIAIPGTNDWVINTAIITVVAYGGTFILGLPAFLMLRSRNLATPWIVAALGLAIGSVTWMALITYLAVALGLGLEATGERFLRLPSDQISLLASGLLGTLVGVTIWAIAHPDRAVHQP